MILDWSQHHLIPATETLLEVGTSYYSPKTFQFVSEKRQQASVEEIGTVMKSYFDVLREMEKLFLRDSIYLTGDTITIADIRVACEILYSRVFNVDFSPYPNVGRPVFIFYIFILFLFIIIFFWELLLLFVEPFANFFII